MRSKGSAVFVLVGALVALGLSGAWAASRAHHPGHHYGPAYGRSWKMMGASGKRSAWYLDGTGKSVTTIAAARSRAQEFAGRLGLRTDEVMRFTNNYYVLLVDGQGKPATEVLVDPRTGTVTLEYGPAMMWNTRYGMMTGVRGSGIMGGTGYGGMMGGSYPRGGMMGGTGNGGTRNGGRGYGGMMGQFGGTPNWAPAPGDVSGPVDAAHATEIATRWLAGQGGGQTVGRPDALPGYFTFDTLRDGKTSGMLSVNASTGALWNHWWHGRFLQMEE